MSPLHGGVGRDPPRQAGGLKTLKHLQTILEVPPDGEDGGCGLDIGWGIKNAN